MLLSHNHYDHCDLATLRQLDRRFAAPVVTPLGNGERLRSAGVRAIEERDWWERAASGRPGCDVVLTPAQHFSARTPFDRNRARWSGFHLTVAGSRIYFAGDTGYSGQFDEIARRLPGPPDLALLPIGAYEPRWFMRDVT